MFAQRWTLPTTAAEREVETFNVPAIRTELLALLFPRASGRTTDIMMEFLCQRPRTWTFRWSWFLQHIGCFTLGTGGYCRMCSNAAVSAFVANGVFTSTALCRGVSCVPHFMNHPSHTGNTTVENIWLVNSVSLGYELFVHGCMVVLVAITRDRRFVVVVCVDKV